MAGRLIYIVEDEKHIQELVAFNLEETGYTVERFDNGERMLQECTRRRPDLFILDLMLPGMDGLEICRRIKLNPDLRLIPIIMLTAKGEEFDRVLGLELGADDYITKPFSVRELIARVKALFRRQSASIESSSDVIKAGKISIDFSRREVYKDEQMIDVTYKEFELLKLLIANKGKVLPRDVLLEKIWGFDYYGESRTVDVHIRYLRQKLEDDDNNPVYIETIRGIGYRFSDKEGRMPS